MKKSKKKSFIKVMKDKSVKKPKAKVFHKADEGQIDGETQSKSLS
ncbi:hypothetical protein [Neobacillus mesonae]|nr:hypothetical protein [Neobacillus mesonae]